MFTRHEMLELIVVDDGKGGHHRPRPGHRRDRDAPGRRVVLATGGYGNVFYLSTNAMGSNVTAAWRAHRAGAAFANPCYTQIHRPASRSPAIAPVEADADVGVAAQRRPDLGAQGRRATSDRTPDQIPEADRDYYLERIYPSFGNLVRATSPPRRRRTCATRGAASARRSTACGAASTSTSRRDRAAGPGDRGEVRQPVFDMYARITGENPYETPMRIYPAVHYTMGGLWVDYDLMSHDPRPVRDRRGELLRPRRQPPRGSALMQGLADGYFMLPHTIRDYLADGPFEKVGREPPPVVEARKTRSRTGSRTSCPPSGTRSVDSFHRRLGNIMWEYCGMERTEDGLKKAIV